MTRNSWRQNLHGRTSQKQTHCHDAFGTVQRNIQWIPTVNIWMVNPSVSSKLKVRYIGMKLSNFCFVSSLPTCRRSVKRISENFALLFWRILAWTSVWPFGKIVFLESQFTIESGSLWCFREMYLAFDFEQSVGHKLPTERKDQHHKSTFMKTPTPKQQ